MTNPPSLACEAGILIHILQARNRGSEKLKGLPTPANLHWQDCGQAHFRRVNIHQLLESSWRVEAGSEPGFPDQIPLFSFTHRCLSMGHIKYHLPHFSYFVFYSKTKSKEYSTTNNCTMPYGWWFNFDRNALRFFKNLILPQEVIIIILKSHRFKQTNKQTNTEA